MSKRSESPGWIRGGALWTYHTPPNPVQQAKKNIRDWKELRAKWRERLGEEVFQCPECGSGNYGEWMMGWWPTEEHYHDPNRKQCEDCGHFWWIVCPTCDHNKGRTKEDY